MTAYFKHLPNAYVGTIDSDERINYQLVKNIFRRVILEEKLEKFSTQFEAFYIQDGMRPDTIANMFYSDPELDWIILVSNNIIDIYSQWPLESNTLLEYIKNSYGDPDGIHHWETLEVKYNNSIFVNRGIEVNESYRVILPDGTSLSKESSIYPVTNYEHEVYLNEKKRLIAVPTNRLVDFFKKQFKQLVGYTLPNPYIDSNGNKKTPISTASQFIDKSPYRVGSTGRVASSFGEEITSFDYGPTTTTTTNSSTASTAGSTTTTTTSSNTTVTTTTQQSSSGGVGGY